jgi:hypothetical protein
MSTTGEKPVQALILVITVTRVSLLTTGQIPCRPALAAKKLNTPHRRLYDK